MLRHSYRTQLKAAGDEPGVVALVQRYLGEWTRDEIERLPRGAWPASAATSDDVLEHAVKLSELHAGFAGEQVALPGLQELLLFFTHAAVRLMRLRHDGRLDDGRGRKPARRQKVMPA